MWEGIASMVALRTKWDREKEERLEEEDKRKEAMEYAWLLRKLNSPLEGREGAGKQGRRRSAVEAAYKMLPDMHRKKAKPRSVIKPSLSKWFVVTAEPPPRSQHQLELEHFCLTLFPSLCRFHPVYFKPKEVL